MRFLEKLKAYMQELGEDEDDFEEEDPVPGAQTSSTNLDRKAEPKETHDHGTKQKAANKLLESVPPVERIEMFRPSRYEDCQQIADALKVGHAAVVDYYYTLESAAKSIRCFMSGFVYAAEGCEERLSAHVYVYMPRHAGIQSGPKHATHEHTLRFPWGR